MGSLQDAWLDSIQVDPRYAGKNSMVRINEHDDKDDVRELSSKEIGAMKKRIANLLEPGETVKLIEAWFFDFLLVFLK